MEINSCEEDQLQAYNLLFTRTTFGFVSALNLENLKFFSLDNQQRLGKIDIKFNINAIKKLPNVRNLDYIMMTEYSQILTITFLLRGQNNADIKVITTKSMLYSAQIYALQFYKKVKEINQIVKSPSFEEQSIIYDNYDIEFNRSFADWVGLFSRKQLDDCFDKCIGLNYGEKYTTQTGVQIIPYPSGQTIGSAVWLMESRETKQNLLWVQGIAHHSWRACKQFAIDKIHKKIDNLIFTAGTLNNIEENQQDLVQCQSFLDVLFQRLTKSHNSKIVLKDFLMICDIINVIVYKFKERFKKIIVTGLSASKMITYANSYVQFLTQNHRNRIYEDPPAYPFQSFEDLKEKMFHEGSNLQEIAEHLKIPVKELILRSTPYIHFQSDFQANIEEGQNANSEMIMQNCVNIAKLTGWMKNCPIANIILFTKTKAQGDPFFTKILTKLGRDVAFNLIGERLQQASRARGIHLTAEGEFGRYLSAYKKQEGWIKVQPYCRHYRLIEKNWISKMMVELEKAGIEVSLSPDRKLLKTGRSQIRFLKDKVMVVGDCLHELRVMDQAFEKVSKIIMLQ